MSQGIEHKTGTFRKWANLNVLGLVLLAAAFGVSAWRAVLNHEQITERPDSGDRKIIRICHWQLEPGYRNAIQAVIDQYEKLRPDVHVIQIPIGEKVYVQWLNTHMIAGTAPDVSEMGMGQLAADDQYVSRFYLPLTDKVDSPNLYNQGTDLEGVPWRDTFVDGMRRGYLDTLQDYYGAPTCVHTIRMFYNKEMLKRATGSDVPPRTLGGLFTACQALRDLGERTGERITPIAGNRDCLDLFLSRYAAPFTAGYEKDLDLDLDGKMTLNETYIGFCRGRLSLRDPAMRAYYECIQAISEQFAQGFLGMGREMSVYSFVMGHSGMMATGSWDAMSLFTQARFDVGVMDFPLPGPGERWHEQLVGRRNEAVMAGGAQYGICKYSAHPDVALDFLKYMTSQKGNELLTTKAGLIPITIGADLPERMRPFMPDPVGYVSKIDLRYGNYMQMRYNGELERYMSGQSMNYDQFVQNVESALLDPSGGDRGWAIEYDTKVRWARNQERALATQSIRELMDPAARDAHDKYIRQMLQQVRANNGQDLRYRFEQVRKKMIPEI